MLHGSAYEFLRNSALDARNFFDPPQKQPFRRSQFGASGGAPIRKDKTFLFVDYRTAPELEPIDVGHRTVAKRSPGTA